LLDPGAVKTYLAYANLTTGRKEKVCQDVVRFYKLKQIPFEIPRYYRIDTIPFVPQESEIDQLISGYGEKTAAFLQLLKETGMRPEVDFEAHSLASCCCNYVYLTLSLTFNWLFSARVALILCQIPYDLRQSVAMRGKMMYEIILFLRLAASPVHP